MEDDTVDFNIQNYNIDDLEFFFKLDEIPNYGTADIEKQAADVQTNLLNGGSFNPNLKKGFIDFIDRGKQKLLQHAKSVSPGPAAARPFASPAAARPFASPAAAGPFASPAAAGPYTDGMLIKDTGTGPKVERPSSAAFVYADPSHFFEGSLNPLNTRILTRIINIDTRFRDNLEKNSADFIIQLPMKFYKVSSMEVSAMEIPISFYGISKSLGNQFFTLVVNVGGVEHTQIVTIPDGDYLRLGFIDTLNIVVGSYSPDPANPFSCVFFSMDMLTKKTTVTALTDTLPTIQSIELYFDRDLKGQFDTTPLPSKSGYNMGFTGASYIGSLAYTSESLIEPHPIKYMFLSVDDFQNNVSNNAFVSAFQKSYLDNNILARISVNDIYENVVINDDELLSAPRQYFGPVDIQKLRIRLCDEYGRTIDMNGMNYSFCLTLKQLYSDVSKM